MFGTFKNEKSLETFITICYLVPNEKESPLFLTKTNILLGTFPQIVNHENNRLKHFRRDIMFFCKLRMIE